MILSLSYICFWNWLLIFCSLNWQIRFIDNTDPAGIDHQIAQLGSELASTLVIVISKVCFKSCLISLYHFLFFFHCSLLYGLYMTYVVYLIKTYLLRVEVPLKQEMICWKYRKPSVKLVWILQNRFWSQVLVSAFICFPLLQSMISKFYFGYLIQGR